MLLFSVVRPKGFLSLHSLHSFSHSHLHVSAEFTLCQISYPTLSGTMIASGTSILTADQIVHKTVPPGVMV